MKNFLYPIFLSIVLLGACETSDEPYLDSSDIPIVVEGWIEEGKAPVVMVTHAADLTVDNPSFDNLLEKWCRVTIYDNDKPYVLTGKRNEAYMPPLVFTSSRLKGKTGHTYRLTVETDDRTLTATATMLPAPAVDSVRACLSADSLYYLKAYTGNMPAGSFHKFFLKTLPGDSRYYPAFMGNVAADSYNPSEGTTLTKGKRVALSDSTAAAFNHFFKSGDRVLVTCASLEPRMYEMWRVYDANISFSENLFFTFTSNLPSNIEGGLGYFAAYGTSERAVAIP